MQSTSGTTGRRVVAFYTQEDIDVWEDCCARAIMAAGGTKDDVCHVAYGYGLFTGGAGLHGGSHRVGCMTLPMSSGNTERQIQFMEDLGSTILCCTPSYAASLGESINEGGHRENIKLKAGIFGAEPWTEEMRHNIEESLGIKAYDIYGLTEISGPGVSFECEEQKGMHIQEDHFIPEIINPDTGEVLPEVPWYPYASSPLQYREDNIQAVTYPCIYLSYKSWMLRSGPLTSRPHTFWASSSR